MKEGKEILIEGGSPIIKNNAPGQLHIEWPLTSFTGKLVMDVNEKQLKITMGGNENSNWFFELSVADSIALPFTKITPHAIHCRFEKMNYQVKATKGYFSKSGKDEVIRIKPEGGELILNFSGVQ